MDQWTDVTRPDRVSLPTLRAVSGNAMRVLPIPDDVAVPFPDELPVSTPPWPTGDDPLLQIRVLIVGDDLLARRGVLDAVDGQPDMMVVGEHRSGRSGYAAVAAQDPDVVLLHGLSAPATTAMVAAVRRAPSPARVLSVGVQSRQTTGDPVSGVAGVLPAWSTLAEVAAAVRLAAAGFTLHTDGPGSPPTGPEPAGPDGRTAAGRPGWSDWSELARSAVNRVLSRLAPLVRTSRGKR